MRKFYFALFLGILVSLTIGLSVSWTAHHTDATDKLEHIKIRNKEIVHHVFSEALNNGNVAPIEAFVATNFVRHGNPEITGPEGLIGLLTMYRNAFPDMTMTFDDQIAEGDKVVSRWTVTGTHTGEMMGIAPTSKKVTVTGISIDRMKDGKIVEEWENFDELGMMVQLGLVPMLEASH